MDASAGTAKGGIMTDTEKIKLIGKMINDFWEFHTNELITAGAETFITSIYSVVELEEDKTVTDCNRL